MSSLLLFGPSAVTAAIGTPWVGTPVQGAVTGTNVLTVTVDVSGATNGEVVWIIGTLGDAQPGPVTPPAGWFTLGTNSEGTSGANSSQTAIFWKVKTAGDTTITITDATDWTVACRVQFVPISWPGVDTTTPGESLAWAVHTSGTSYLTGSGTPTAADRWAVGVFSVRGSTALVAWSSDATLVSRASFTTTSNPWTGLYIEDSAASVTQAAHTYTATGQTSSHGLGAVFYLIPAAVPVGIDLIIQDAAQAQTADSFALGQVHALATQPAAQAQTSDNVALTLAVSLAVQGATQAQTAGSAALTQAHILAVAAAGQAQTSASVALGVATVVDITFTIGPTRLRELATVGPTRPSTTVGPTRTGVAAALTRLRGLLTMGPTRGGTQAGATRAGTAVDNTRTGTTAGPTRRDRGV